MAVNVKTEIDINRPRSEVASYASDPDNATSWYQNIRSVEWKSPRPLTAGSRVAFVASFLGRCLACTYEVKELAPGQRFVQATAEGPFPMETTYTWDDNPDGGTRMRLATGASLPASRNSRLRSWPARCARPIRRTWPGSRRSWMNLKAPLVRVLLHQLDEQPQPRQANSLRGCGVCLVSAAQVLDHVP